MCTKCMLCWWGVILELYLCLGTCIFVTCELDFADSALLMSPVYQVWWGGTMPVCLGTCIFVTYVTTTHFFSLATVQKSYVPLLLIQSTAQIGTSSPTHWLCLPLFVALLLIQSTAQIGELFHRHSCCGSDSFPAVPFRWVWILLNNCIVLNGLSPLPLSRQC